MDDPAVAAILAGTWTVLLVAYAVNSLFVRHRFLRDRLVVAIDSQAAPARPGSLLSQAGVLLVFVANIAALLLAALAALLPAVDAALRPLRIPLPPALRILGSVLFVLYSAWGLLVLFFNPNYTPLFRRPEGPYTIATAGPYRIVRHPRYSAEALFNVAAFLFTGLWLPLLGLAGWIAVYYQARAEDGYLAALGGPAYEAYRRRTGMLLPRLRKAGAESSEAAAAAGRDWRA